MVVFWVVVPCCILAICQYIRDHSTLILGIEVIKVRKWMAYRVLAEGSDQGDWPIIAISGCTGKSSFRAPERTAGHERENMNSPFKGQKGMYHQVKVLF